MQLKILNKLIPLTAAVLLTASGSIAKPNSFKDERDGQVYKTVKIGKQVWMAENLKYKSKDSYCYDDKTTNCKKYGRLYTWYDAMNSCPAGFHLPSDDEWRKLLEYIKTDNNLGVAEKAGTYLKSKTGWKSTRSVPAGNDKNGFSGLPAGTINNEDGSSNDDMGLYGGFWSSTEISSSRAYYYDLHYDREDLDRNIYDKILYAMSVRCLKGSLEKIVIKEPGLKYLNPDIDYRKFKDERDGQMYKTVKIGDQVWMAENLNYETEESYCYDDETANCKKYGRLYTWEAAKSACPAGYHLPSDAEWDVLLKFVLADNNLGSTNKAGTYLKSKIGWIPSNGDPAGTDKYGFSGLPAGSRGDYDGSYYYMGDYGDFWSATESNSYLAYIYNLYYGYESLHSDLKRKKSANSVRCVKGSN